MASPTSYVAAIRRLDLQVYYLPAVAEASEAEAAIPRSRSVSRISPRVAVQAELKTRTARAEESGDGRGGQRSIRKVEGGENGGGDEWIERVVPGNAVGDAAGKSEGGKRKRKNYGTGGCKEEEEAVVVIAGVLKDKFGPQIVREELEDRRVVSPASLLSLYRFFSSHLGISSPSTVASLLTSKPQLLRSNPTNDFLPRVRLLQELVREVEEALDQSGIEGGGTLRLGGGDFLDVENESGAQDGTGGGVVAAAFSATAASATAASATAASATAASATAAFATAATALPLLDLLQLFLWVTVPPAVAEELLLKGLLLMDLQERLGR
ncbi:unnamed protein product [Closterium sp. Naga37s-1]|nr:unnamed protein product [Closterium sp. Naga37s-1]